MSNITDKIKTLDDVANALNLDMPAIHAGIMELAIPEKDKLNMIADYNWEKIVEALNEGWLADYTDHNQDKYWPYAWVEKDEKDPSGFGFSSTDTTWTYSDADVGARLLFKNRELALYAIKQFHQEYKCAMLVRREEQP